MKIGVLKIGANITQSVNSKSAGNYDIFSLMDMIKDSHNITFMTKITRNTYMKPEYTVVDIMSAKDNLDYDILLIFNGAINFFGGEDSPELIENWKIINKFKGKIFYVMTDLRYPLYQIVDFFKNKKFKSNYDSVYDEILITRNDINIIYQGRDKELLYKKILQKKISKRIVDFNYMNIHHFPIDWAINMVEQKIYKTPFKDRKTDLIYGGANRDSHRRNRLQEYFCNKDLNISLFGPIKLECGIKNSGTVSQNQFTRRMSRSKATIIVGDKTYEDNMFTLRMYESIYAGCVLFIDDSFDPHKKFFNGDSLLSFNYVSTRKELNSKLLSLTEDTYRSIVNRQLEIIKDKYDKKQYRDLFISIIKNSKTYLSNYEE